MSSSYDRLLESSGTAVGTMLPCVDEKVLCDKLKLQCNESFEAHELVSGERSHKTRLHDKVSDSLQLSRHEAVHKPFMC